MLTAECGDFCILASCSSFSSCFRHVWKSWLDGLPFSLILK